MTLATTLPRSAGLTFAVLLVVASASGCGESRPARQGEAPETGAAPAEDAAAPPSRPLPSLGPSELEWTEVVTGGASADASLPLIIALHDLGGSPESFSKLFEGFDHGARFIVPRGPLKHEEGRAWLLPGPDAAVKRMVTRSADKVAALADEIAASRPTKGKAIVVGISQGGLIAFVVAARHPERVRAVVPVGASLPQALWPDEEEGARGGPTVRAMIGADDEHTKATDVRRAIVKLRMLELDATVRLYAGTGHVVSPAMGADLFRTLRWLVSETPAPSPCEACPGGSMDPEACTLCPTGPEGPAFTEAAKVASSGAAPRRAEGSPPGDGATKSDGPDLTLGAGGLGAGPKRGTGGGGGLSREQIQQAFRLARAPIRFCHERELAAHPGLSGRVTIRFVVAADGSVSSAQVASSTLGNDAVAECVRRAVTRVRFPSPAGGGSTTITYPFMFAAAQQ